MATESPMITDGGQTVAAANYSNSQSLHGPSGSGQFLAVKLGSTARTVTLASSAIDNIYGILQNKPKTGEAAEVCIFGVCKAVSGSTVIASGAALQADTSGRLVTQSASNPKVAVALEAATAVDQIITVKVVPTPG